MTAFNWRHLDGHVAADLAWLRSAAGLPEAVIQAMTALETRPRCEVFPEGALINLRGLSENPANDPDRLVSIRLWASHGTIISISFRRMAGLDALRDQYHAGRISDPGDAIADMATLITARLDPHVADLGDTLDDCEAALDPARAWEMRRTITRIRSDAIFYRRFIAPQREALSNLAELNCHWLEADDRLHLREAADRFARMAEELEAIRERAALIHEQLTDLRAEQLDSRTLILSIVAMVFLPLTFITGLLGMNVAGIPYANAPWAFWAVVGFCSALALGVIGWFVTAHWLRK
jgi:zinc transporter